MTTVISVRFQTGQKSYYFDPQTLDIAVGQHVIVETAQGLEYAICTEANHEVAEEDLVAPLRPVVRIATDNDRHTAEYNHSREAEAFDICLKRIAAHALDMKLVRVECSFDGTKILFFFTADGRVDFRDLVKDLASVFRSRIELRQIGVRDEAKMIGGLGICGRSFCCNQFLEEFIPVSIKMAKTQNLSLNPTKISGTCGRLMCCLKYEQDAYEDALKRMPKNDSFVLTPDGPGNVSEINLLKETVRVILDDAPESPQYYRNSEIIVLRNGKGTRDGIIIPKNLPERYVAPVVEEYIPPFISTPVIEPEIESEIITAEEENPSLSHRHHRSRNRRRKDTSVKVTPEPIQIERAQEISGETITVKKNHRKNPGDRKAALETKVTVPVEPVHLEIVPEAAAGKPSSRRHRPRGGKKINATEIKAVTPVVSEVAKEPKENNTSSGEAKKPHRRYRHRPRGKKPSNGTPEV